MKPASIIVGNWKMNGNLAEATILLTEISRRLSKNNEADNKEIIICPPAVWLTPLAEILEKKNHQPKIKLGIQNIHWENPPTGGGAFTGEISAEMVKNLVDYVIVGHSERRGFFNETNAIVNRKTKAVLAASLTPIICLGEEAKSQLPAADNLAIDQLEAAIDGLSATDMEKIIIAYEPIWAIGSRDNATSVYAAAIIHRLRRWLMNKVGLSAQEIPILYGGSVNSQNAKEYLLQPEINGLLVATASLNAKEFVEICQT
ncbi:MAG: triosephosphate isomerase (TIM) [Candidatus Berkelbacteria bacterium Licking1014_2]|uniref:Triosephosphate isomerase n=1 Tax=Candidatus Berkelbacteria bacterium Licking1014_2 TaxID=2017146 RepID=A0A554LXA6_9BACT|nr:MAG: triosephosphate isomerase (TIM) [Candidatus Berkelbacteria bacterium Licking1014_2]